MKKVLMLSVALLFVASFVIAAPSKKDVPSSSPNNVSGKLVIKVIADAVPHAELLNFVKPKLAKRGIDLKIIIISDYTLANSQTDSGEADANFFQHLPYLQAMAIEKGMKLASAGAIHIEPIGIYSTKYKSLAEIPEDSTISIPNDSTNEYRALKLLEANGFIKLKANAKASTISIHDIAKYLKKVKLVEMDSGLTVRSRDQFAAYITNTNRILEAKIDPKTALAKEDGTKSPYANIIVVKKNRLSDPAIKALVKELQSEDTRNFINKKYKGAVVAAF